MTEENTGVESVETPVEEAESTETVAEEATPEATPEESAPVSE